jgi:ribosomal protein S27AE
MARFGPEQTRVGPLRQEVVDYAPRCRNPNCGRVLASHLTRPWSLLCRKCHTPNSR